MQMNLEQSIGGNAELSSSSCSPSTVIPVLHAFCDLRVFLVTVVDQLCHNLLITMYSLCFATCDEVVRQTCVTRCDKKLALGQRHSLWCGGMAHLGISSKRTLAQDTLYLREEGVRRIFVHWKQQRIEFWVSLNDTVNWFLARLVWLDACLIHLTPLQCQLC